MGTIIEPEEEKRRGERVGERVGEGEGDWGGERQGEELLRGREAWNFAMLRRFWKRRLETLFPARLRIRIWSVEIEVIRFFVYSGGGGGEKGREENGLGVRGEPSFDSSNSL